MEKIDYIKSLIDDCIKRGIKIHFHNTIHGIGSVGRRVVYQIDVVDVDLASDYDTISNTLEMAIQKYDNAYPPEKMELKYYYQEKIKGAETNQQKI